MALRKFGKDINSEFMFDKNYKNINHGSFGVSPLKIFNYRVEVLKKIETKPDIELRQESFKLIEKSILKISEIVNSPFEDIVLVSNATTGVNTILRSLKWENNDIILCFNTGYGACLNSIKFIVDHYKDINININIVEVTINYPIIDKNLCENFEKAILAINNKKNIENNSKLNGKVKLALFDAISSLPGVLVPYEELISICKKHNVLSLVDGAHAIGQIPLSLKESRPDFFVSNLHKWNYAPRPIAFMYVDKKYQANIHSSPISWSYNPKNLIYHYDNNNHIYLEKKLLKKSIFSNNDLSPFQMEFFWNGTIDSSIFSIVPYVFQYIDEVLGGQVRVMSYNKSLAEFAGKEIAKQLSTKVLQNDNIGCNQVIGSIEDAENGKWVWKSREKNDLIGSMVNVMIPLDENIPDEKLGLDYINKRRNQLEQFLIKRNTFLPFFRHSNCWWIRFSAQVYLDKSDVYFTCKILKELIENVNTCKCKL